MKEQALRGLRWWQGRWQEALPGCSTPGDARLALRFHHDENFGMCKAPCTCAAGSREVFGSLAHRSGIHLLHPSSFYPVLIS